MKIGILVTGHVNADLVKKFGEYPAMFKHMLTGYRFLFETYSVMDGEFPPSADACDGWLITGSRHGAYEDHFWIRPLEDFIKKAYAKTVPMVGICFGHQIMAQALGGKVEKWQHGWGLGRTLFATDNGPKHLLAIHQDQVTEKPAEASVIASSDFCAFAGLNYQGKALSFQPHPEFSVDFLKALIEVNCQNDRFSRAQADSAIAGLDGEHHSPEIAARIANFFLKAKARRAA